MCVWHGLVKNSLGPSSSTSRAKRRWRRHLTSFVSSLQLFCLFLRDLPVRESPGKKNLFVKIGWGPRKEKNEITKYLKKKEKKRWKKKIPVRLRRTWRMEKGERLTEQRVEEREKTDERRRSSESYGTRNIQEEEFFFLRQYYTYRVLIY